MNGKRKALGKGLSALLPDPEPERRSPRTRRRPRSPIGRLEPNPYQPRAPRSTPRGSPSWRPPSARAGSSSPSWCGGGRALPDHRGRAALAGGPAARPRHASRSPCARCPTSGCSSSRSSRTSSARSSPRSRRPRPSSGCRTSCASPRRRSRAGGRATAPPSRTRCACCGCPASSASSLAEGRLDAGHARALLALERAEDQVALGREAARKGLSVREVERRVALLRAPRAAGGRRARTPNTAAAEERLRARARAPASRSRGAGKGGAIRIAVHERGRAQPALRALLRAGAALRRRQAGPSPAIVPRAARTASTEQMIKLKGLAAEDLNGFMDEGTEFLGELRFRDILRIDGRLKGEDRLRQHADHRARRARSTPRSTAVSSRSGARSRAGCTGASASSCSRARRSRPPSSRPSS